MKLDSAVFKDILEKVQALIEKEGFSFRSRISKDKWVAVNDREKVIGPDAHPAHYEYIERDGNIFLELHFELTGSAHLFHQQMKLDNPKLEWFDWQKKCKSIRFVQPHSIDDKNLSQLLANDLVEFDQLVGDEVRGIINTQNLSAKSLEQVIDECNISFKEVKLKHKEVYDAVFETQKNWLNNLEDRTNLLKANVKPDVDYVIHSLKSSDYRFTSNDTDKLSVFVSQVNGIVSIVNRINNFKEGVALDSGNGLRLFELFNSIKTAHKFSDLSVILNKNLSSFLPHLYSVVKHCQSPDNYPIYYRYWKNILGEVLKRTDDYDSLCDFYKEISEPKHLSLGAYFGSIGTILALKLTENSTIKEEDDKNYKYVRNKILNIHYFDLITGYLKHPKYYLIGSKYGANNDEDVFPEMLEKQVVSVGFASHLDLSDFYSTDENEITEYLKDENENQSSINALKHFLAIKPGDLVAVKASGSPKGKQGFLSIVGLCEVVRNEDGQVYNYEPEGLGHTLNVRYLQAPIYKEFSFGGYGSTVHLLSKKDQIAAIFGDEPITTQSFDDVKRKFEVGVFDTFVDSLRQLIEQLNIQFDDERVVYSVRKDRLNFTVGQRYCFNLFYSDAKGQFGVISKTKIKSNSKLYKGDGTQPYYTQFNEFNPSSSEWDSIIESIQDELNRTSVSGYRKYNNSDFEGFVFKKELKGNKKPMHDLNNILFGPPGTGKTYSTMYKAVCIIEDKKEEELKIEKYTQIKSRYDKYVKEGQVVFTTFHQSLCYEDFIEGIKPEQPKQGDTYLRYEIRDGLFKNICFEAQKLSTITVEVDEKLQQELTPDMFEEFYNDFAATLVSSEENDSNLNLKTQADYEFGLFRNSAGSICVKAGQKKAKMSTSLNQLSAVLFKGKNPTYKSYEQLIIDAILSDKKYKEAKTNNQQKNFVLIIDEINRGNVSQIFGELITLIEEDKRIGKPEALTVTLPYSQDTFGVPSNIYIIGTMNTADRSVEALDAALRRRFTFTEMAPKPSLIDTERDGNPIMYVGETPFNLVNLLETINRRLEVLLDKDHLIGHSFFMKVSDVHTLKRAFSKEIIPLLQEYFYGDFGKISLVLGEGFCIGEKIPNDVDLFAKTTDYDHSVFLDKLVYRLYDPLSAEMNEAAFKDALIKLLNDKSKS